MAKIKKISDLKFDQRNINKGSEYGSSLLEKSLREVGAGRSVLADKNGVLIAGNKTIEMAGQVGIDRIRVVETSGDEIVVVQRTDLDINTPERARMKILDNTVSRHNYIEDAEVAEAVCEEYDLQPAELGVFSNKEEEEGGEEKSKHGLFPLSIILTKSDYSEWQNFKKSYGFRGDTEAFLKLMTETTVKV